MRLIIKDVKIVHRKENSVGNKGNVLSIDHTYAYKEGMGVGSLLVSAVNDYAVSKGLKVLPVCSFAAVWYQRHPQFQDILE